jgi:hypothetical protein
MAFHVAMGRLKAALIPHLIGQQTGPMRSIFRAGFQVSIRGGMRAGNR